MADLKDYNYSITCDRCDQHVCWWRWGGPFQGSVVCDQCHEKGDEQLEHNSGDKQ